MQLHRLFGDERLDVRARKDAPEAILAGARRVRRRRRALTATGGTLTALVLVAGGLVLGDLRSTRTDTAAPVPSTMLSASTTALPPSSIPLAPQPGSSSPDVASGSASGYTSPETSQHVAPPSRAQDSTPPSTPSAKTFAGPVLGPVGYGKLVLGMPYAAAVRTGQLAATAAPQSGCTQYPLAEGSANIRTVTISDTQGIVSFEASGARTPERVGIGSSKDDLEAAYPSLAESATGYTAAAGSGATYVFSVDDRNRVTGLRLVGPASC
ncbi:hypothetical protein GCM10017566_35270 [Amycolatopsis bartoniae]|uniref:Uncharacterized protein n=1 Tax=Amycolatopsis bartoniae TaxID=941986 RepID=A0A8H9J0E6_9PSEU|nr:hypothetical protein GCM10017566_35270 [Amycolatopsis bartoniae]